MTLSIDLVLSFYKRRNPEPTKFWDPPKLKASPDQNTRSGCLSSAYFSTSGRSKAFPDFLKSTTNGKEAFSGYFNNLREVISFSKSFSKALKIAA